MHRVRLQILVAQNIRPHAFQQRHSVFLRQIRKQHMLGHAPNQHTGREIRNRHQHQRHFGRLNLLNHPADIGHGFAFWFLLQEIVAANADQHELGILLHQTGQPRQCLRAGITRHAAIDDVPTRDFGQLRRIIFARARAVTFG